MLNMICFLNWTIIFCHLKMNWQAIEVNGGWTMLARILPFAVLHVLRQRLCIMAIQSWLFNCSAGSEASFRLSWGESSVS